MAFGDIETEEPCLHGVGQVVERVLDKKWYWAKILGPGRSANTIDLEYLDDQKVEKDVPVSELRSSVIPGTHQHLAVGSRNRSNSKSFQPIGMEDGSGCAGEEGFLCTHGGSNDKSAHYVADAAGGLEHAAYVESVGPESKARVVATQTADEESQACLFPRIISEPRKALAGEVMAVESMDIDQDEPRQAGGEMVGKEGGMIAVKVEDEQLPQVAISGVCAHAGCGQVCNYRCARCGEAFYCGRLHQRQHWSEGHAKMCKQSDWLLQVAMARMRQTSISSSGGATIITPGSGWTFSPVKPEPSHKVEPEPSEGYLPLPLPGGFDTSSFLKSNADGYASDVDEEAARGGGSTAPSSKRVALEPVVEEDLVDFQGEAGGRPPTPITTEKKGVSFSEDALDKGGSRKRRLAGSPSSDTWFSTSNTDSSTTYGGWTSGGAPENLSRRQVSDENIARLMEMGFVESVAREALQWYNDDVERACEFLLITDDNEPSSYIDTNTLFGPLTSGDHYRALCDDDMKTQAGDEADLTAAEELDAIKFSNEVNIRVGARKPDRTHEVHQVTIDVLLFLHPSDLESQRPYAFRFLFKDKDHPQVLDVPGRDVVAGVNLYTPDAQLLLREREEDLIRTLLEEVVATWETDRWVYRLEFPGRVVATSRNYAPLTSAA